MNEANVEITAFVLAGGRSHRMGRDKAFIELDGCSLLDRALQKARAVATEVRIVGPREKFDCYGTVVEDIFPDCGPLGGIHAALVSAATDLNLVLAIDVPSVSEGFLRFLLEQAAAPECLVTVPRVRGGFQPLCAVYRKDFAALAQVALERGRNKIDALFGECSVRVIDEAELAKFEFPAAMFDNLNTPEDIEAARLRRRTNP